jgi:hypothetical protein
VAPHAFDGAHCNDAYEDTMCYAIAPMVRNGTIGQFFDYRNDDYWSLPGHPLPWWTVDENRFLCPDASCNVVSGGDPLAPARLPRPPQRHPGKRAQGHVKVQARHGRHGRWRVRLRAAGTGRGIVVVRCRRYARGQLRTVFSSSTRLPRTLSHTVRCGGSRPQAQLLLAATS